MFRKAAKYFDPPLEVVEMPFEGKKLVGYLQKPPGVTKPPVVMHWGGVDGWKEDRLKIAAAIMNAGLASLTIDMPGSGENPVLYGDPSAERTYLAWLDYLPTRTDVDGRTRRRLGRQLRRLLGGAARLHRRRPHQGRGVPRRQRALRLPEGMAGAGLHHRRRDLSVRRRRACSTRAAAPWASKTIDEFLEAVAPLSLKTMGLLDKPSAPLLGVNGKLDDQAPVADIYLLLEHGNPKSARVYPEATTWAARRARTRTRSRPPSWRG